VITYDHLVKKRGCEGYENRTKGSAQRNVAAANRSAEHWEIDKLSKDERIAKMPKTLPVTLDVLAEKKR